MSRLLVTNKSFELLEPYEGKLSRTVLRGESSRKGADLLDIDQYLNEAHSFGLQSVRAHFNVLAWSDDVQELRHIRNDVGSQLALMECRPRHNTVDAATLYWAGMPGNAGDFPAEESFYTFIEPAVCFFTEETKYQPHSPYSASKASSDHFVRAFHDTYGMPTVVTNCSNNYGPYQFPEKLIPLFINNIRHGKPLPVYGRGENVRDWLYVVDHARAIDLIFHQGRTADTYNIGGFNEWKNIDLIKVIIKTVDRLLGNPEGTSECLITYVTDRKGHDLRYAIDSNKLKHELGWEPSLQFEEGIERTVRWYLDNQEWMDHITSGEYEKYYESMYKNR